MIRFELTTIETSGYDDDGFIGVQPSAFGTTNGADSGMGPYQQVLPLGYYARPLDRDATGIGCWGIVGTEGGKGYAWTIQDPRYASKVPPLSKGSRAIATDAGAFFLLDYDAQTGTLYVPVNGGSQAHLVQVGYDQSMPPQLCLNLIHADGMAIMMTNQSIVIKNAAGDAFIELNSTGTVINGNTKLVGGLDVGGSRYPAR